MPLRVIAEFKRWANMMNRLATFLSVALFATLVSAQGIVFDCFHLVRLDYLLEEERAIKFARPVDISLPKYDFELARIFREIGIA